MRLFRLRFTTRRAMAAVAGLAILCTLARSILPDSWIAGISVPKRSFLCVTYDARGQIRSMFHVELEKNAVRIQWDRNYPSPDGLMILQRTRMRRVTFREICAPVTRVTPWFNSDAAPAARESPGASDAT